MKAEWPKRLEYKSFFYISVLFIHFFILVINVKMKHILTPWKVS